MSTTAPIGGPHTHSPGGVSAIMGQVFVALLPATAFGLYLFGWPAFNLLVLTVVSALAAEAISLWISGRPLRPALADGSAALTGWLLAMTLPPTAPWWTAVVGGAFAIIVGKQVFGGLGQNIFNPAMLARVALLISFPVELTTWAAPAPIGSPGAPGFLAGLGITFLGEMPVDMVTGASVLGHIKTELGTGQGLSEILPDAFSPLSSGLGNMYGSLGETSALLILLGGVYLMLRRIITWHIPVSMLITVGALSGIFHLIEPGRYADPGVHLLSGGLMLGAFFIATDMVTSPSNPRGQLLFGAGCGALVYVIRTWGGYPEGVAFSVLIMNALTPLIDHYLRPRIYGRTRHGSPIDYKEAGGDLPPLNAGEDKTP